MGFKQRENMLCGAGAVREIPEPYSAKCLHFSWIFPCLLNCHDLQKLHLCRWKKFHPASRKFLWEHLSLIHQKRRGLSHSFSSHICGICHCTDWVTAGLNGCAASASFLIKNGLFSTGWNFRHIYNILHQVILIISIQTLFVGWINHIAGMAKIR